MNFLKTLTPSLQITLDPTGNYERDVIEALGTAQIDFSRVNAYQIRAFATRAGLLAKTDAIDALILAKFGEHRQPKPTQALNKDQEELRSLYDRRGQLINARTRESNRLETALPTMKTHLKKSLKFINTQLQEIDIMIHEYFSTHAEAQEKTKHLQSVVVVGKQTAAALVGVALFSRDSGKLLNAVPFSVGALKSDGCSTCLLFRHRKAIAF